jgi:hypothetical protein
MFFGVYDVRFVYQQGHAGASAVHYGSGILRSVGRGPEQCCV